MPTGYTCDIKNGISFEEFIMGCAKAFGACVTMRDEPRDAEIPEKFKVSDYHKKELNRLESELSVITQISEREAEKLANEEFREKKQKNNKRIKEKKELESNYRCKLVEANSWTPPSSYHIGLKDFMISQIQKSIEWDCDTSHITDPKLLPAKEWLLNKINKVKKDIEYQSKQLMKEKKRVDDRNLWIKQLRNSLK